MEEQLRAAGARLTALKGALKEEVASRDQEVEHVRQQCQRDTEQQDMRDRPRHVVRAGLGKRGHPQGEGCLEALVCGDFVSWSSPNSS